MRATKRAEAINRGLRFYWNGKPCSKGHVGPRYTDSKCKQCRSDAKRKLPDTFTRRTSKWLAAKQAGHRFYEGAACRCDPAHKTKRYVATGACVACTKNTARKSKERRRTKSWPSSQSNSSTLNTKEQSTMLTTLHPG